MSIDPYNMLVDLSSELKLLSEGSKQDKPSPEHQQLIDFAIDRIKHFAEDYKDSLVDDFVDHQDHKQICTDLTTQLKQIDPNSFKELEDALMKVAKKADDVTTLFKTCDKYQHQLTTTKVDDSKLREIGRWIIDSYETFRSVKIPNKHASAVSQAREHLDGLQGAINQLYMNKAAESGNLDADNSVIKKLCDRVAFTRKAITGRNEPTDLYLLTSTFAKHDISFYRELILDNPSQGYAALCEYVNTNKIPLRELHPNEIGEIARYIKHVDLTDYITEDMDEAAIHSLINKFPAMETLIIKGLFYEDKLHSLPDSVSQVKNLKLEFLYNLKTLPALPKATEIEIVYCHAITKMPEMPEVIKVMFQGIPASTLPSMPKLEACTFTNLDNLDSFPEMPLVKKIYLSECQKPTKLPEMPLIESIVLDDLPKLTELTSKPTMPATLKHFSIKKCPSIIRIPVLPKDTRLYYDRLPQLSWRKYLSLSFRRNTRWL